MIQNLDEWLNSLNTDGLLDNSIESSSTDVVQYEEQQEQPEARPVSGQEVDELLAEYGFPRTQDADAEEIQEEESEEEEEEGNPDWDDGDPDWRQYNPEETQSLDFNVIRDNAIRNIESASVASIPTPGDGHGLLDQVELTTISSPAESVIEQPLIPLNSPTLLMDESTTRFSGAEWYNEIQKQHIIVAGQGGIGSNLSFQLARMHPATLFLYDDDMVETVNMAGQLYARNDIGRSKVSAIADMIASYTNMENIYALRQKFDANTEAGDVMMCGFDNMEARKTFFGIWCNHMLTMTTEEKKKCLFLDGRLSIDTLQIFCITGDDETNMLRYHDEFLFSDAEADETVCSMKQTTYLACMIGSLMTNLFTNWVANQLNPVIPYDLPFFTEYDAQNMIFKTVK